MYYDVRVATKNTAVRVREITNTFCGCCRRLNSAKCDRKRERKKKRKKKINNIFTYTRFSEYFEQFFFLQRIIRYEWDHWNRTTEHWPPANTENCSENTNDRNAKPMKGEKKFAPYSGPRPHESQTLDARPGKFIQTQRGEESPPVNTYAPWIVEMSECAVLFFSCAVYGQAWGTNTQQDIKLQLLFICLPFFFFFFFYRRFRISFCFVLRIIFFICCLCCSRDLWAVDTIAYRFVRYVLVRSLSRLGCAHESQIVSSDTQWAHARKLWVPLR